MSRILRSLALGALCASATPLTVAAGTHPAGASAADDARLIRSAMTAAPDKVGATATVVSANADGSLRTVRPGSNGFTCMADNPVTPGPDPMCMDAAALEWAGAWMAHKPPVAGKTGLMYMLSGGTDASNTDPFAQAPQSGNHWIKTGPHVMVVGADPAFYAMYPDAPDPDTAAPYVMWSGTPYQHLMIPVK